MDVSRSLASLNNTEIVQFMTVEFKLVFNMAWGPKRRIILFSAPTRSIYEFIFTPVPRISYVTTLI